MRCNARPLSLLAAVVTAAITLAVAAPSRAQDEAPAAVPAEAAPAEAPARPAMPAKTQPRLLVMDLVDKGAGADVTNAINQAVQGQAVTSHAGEAVTAMQVRLLLDTNAQQQMVGCDAEVCMTDVGKVIEADVILGGNVAKVGDEVVITVLAVDPATGKRVRQEQRKAPINRDLYYYAAKQLTSLVLTGKAADPRVPVVIQVRAGGAAAEASIVVDGNAVATASSHQLELEPGQHEIRVKRADFVEWKLVVDVVEATPLQVTADLVGDRVYLWPVAVATGVIAAGLGVTGFLMHDYARGEFDGSSVFFNQDASKSYSQVAPVNSAQLCAREVEIYNFSGRVGEGENGCGIAAGPSPFFGGVVGGAILMGVATAALLTTDLVLNATAE